ncbi:hypothetical protein VFPPC_14128 [Pochonia chlamydosporia 170]|uniref:Rhodopsin domain-containing protein n=1 Tax=Pochonia chlamydosporia 170 TaxID=1380566 RepID=A0A179F6J3_METCM|nr:hypothetical protein VFPPC_14128 [Pochonia chlamydosporia 170]OAQ60773.1 hypothetical protein VFPPC_14128 [Pochonia chlamydosporia 170]
MYLPFLVEPWIEYGIGVCVLFLRYFAREFRGWEGDDYLAVLALVLWTFMPSFWHVIREYGIFSSLPDEDRPTLTPLQIARYEYSSKLFITARILYVTLIWTLKGCLLFFYNRIVQGLKQQVLVKWAAVVCVLFYLGALATIWGHCTPASKNWQIMPYPGDESVYSRIYFLVLMALNISTDVIILIIPLTWFPMLRIPVWHKIAIGLLLCSGVFAIIAAIVRCILALRDIKSFNNTVMWAIREMFIGIFIVNAAVIKPVFSKRFWFGTREDNNAARSIWGHHNHHNCSPNTSDSLV